MKGWVLAPDVPAIHKAIDHVKEFGFNGGNVDYDQMVLEAAEGFVQLLELFDAAGVEIGIAVVDPDADDDDEPEPSPFIVS